MVQNRALGFSARLAGIQGERTGRCLTLAQRRHTAQEADEQAPLLLDAAILLQSDTRRV